MARLFGTDGVRGVANKELTCETAFKLGQAAVAFQGKTILIGKDTRLSGDMLESAVASGIMSMGGTALLAGIIPTPAIALLVRELHCDGGIVISASHNPPEYNGIKLFDGQGFKLPDAVEDEIEAYLAAGGPSADELPNGDEVGVALPVDDACELYIAHAVSTVAGEGIDFAGLKVALDAGHGASCLTSAEALRRLGAEAVSLNEDFDGTDINVQCGSTHLEPLRALVAETGADVGIAHDGDADRVMLVDANGNEIDGDVVEAVCAIDLHKRGLLAGGTAVSTVMCNLGLSHALRDAGIELVQTKVGDRYVLEAMREGGFVLGGEQSGHVIFLHHSTTGDGELTAGKLLKLLARKHREEGTKMSELNAVYTKFPQVLINLTADKEQKQAYKEDEYIAGFIESQQQNLMGMGRVLVRVSGTEPKIRVMVEGEDMEAIQSSAERIADMIRQRIPGVC